MATQFPKTPDEAEKWQPTFLTVSIHRNVVVVAKTRNEGAWKAYVVPVSVEKDHWTEALERWQQHGSPLLEEYARPMFPRFGDLEYAD